MNGVRYRASDRLTHDTLLRYSLRSKLAVPIQDLERVYGGGLSLTVDDVVPGQPIRIRWRVVLGLSGTDSTSFSIRILIDGNQVYERKGIPVDQATVGGTLALWGDQGLQTETVTIGDPNVARTLYRVGTKTLNAEVRGEGSEVPEFVGSVRFRVVRESLDGSWWDWRGPAFEKIEWKKGYSLVGDFVNRSRYASIATINAELSEVRSDEDPLINPCDYVPIKLESRNGISVGGQAGFSFELLHDWSWLMTATYVIYGPTTKTFAYAVFFHFTDEFGNVYDGQCSAKLARLVDVSDLKLAAAATAQLAAANALALAIAAAAALAGVITAPGAPALFVAAGIAYGIAAGAGAIAKDPPSPDLQYHEPVEIVPLSLPSWPANDASGSLTAMWSLLKSAARLLALENARTVSRARLLGARLAGDEEALEQQRGGYLKIEHEMVETADELQRILPNVQREVEEDDRFDSRTLEPWLDALGQGGLSEDMLRAMDEAELGRAEANGLVALFRYPVLLELVRANGLFLASFVAGLQDFVRGVRGERGMVLEGETYVHVSDRDKRSSDDEAAVPDVEATLRPRKCGC